MLIVFQVGPQHRHPRIADDGSQPPDGQLLAEGGLILLLQHLKDIPGVLQAGHGVFVNVLQILSAHEVKAGVRQDKINGA